MKYLITSLITMLCLAQDIGLEVGTKVPNISLKTISGKEFQTDKLEKKTALIFYRGSWCPYCMKQLQSIQEEVIGKIGKNAQVIAISVDREMIAKKMKDKYKFSFEIVSDPKAQSLLAFNIVNKLDDKLVNKYKQSYKIDIEGDSGETHHMVAHPAVFIISEDKITYRDIHVDYKDRTDNEEIIRGLKE